MTELDFWRQKYKTSPPAFRPIVAILGKLIKFGDNATTKDISPAEMLTFCNAVNLKINFPQSPTSYAKWGIPQAAIKLASERINQTLTAEQCPDELLANFDYDAAKLQWLDYLRDVCRRVKGTDAENAVISFAKKFKNGATLDNHEFHNALIDIVDVIIKPHADLYQRFIKKFLFELPLDVVEKNPNVDFWQAFDNFTGGSLYHTDDPYTLFFFQPDVFRFFQIYQNEVI